MIAAGLILTLMTAAQAEPVTFTKDVAPILQRSCQNCHRPGAISPMSLLTYDDVRPFARAIKEKVTKRQMPPWFIDRNIGISAFKDDPSLSDRDIATISQWVDAGAPQGNPADLPRPKDWPAADAWQFAEYDDDDKLVEAANSAPPSVYGFGHEPWYRNVLRVLRGEAVPDTDGRAGRKSLELILGIYESAKTGREVPLPLVSHR